MPTATAGRNGRLYFDISAAANGSAQPIPLVAKWNVDRTASEHDGTSFGDTTQVKIAGLPAGDISFEGFMDPTDVGYIGVAGDGLPRKAYLYTGSDRTIAYFFTTASVSASTDVDVNGLIKITGKMSNATSVVFKGA